MIWTNYTVYGIYNIYITIYTGEITVVSKGNNFVSTYLRDQEETAWYPEFSSVSSSQSKTESKN